MTDYHSVMTCERSNDTKRQGKTQRTPGSDGPGERVVADRLKTHAFRLRRRLNGSTIIMVPIVRERLSRQQATKAPKPRGPTTHGDIEQW